MNKKLIDSQNKLRIDGHSFECPLVHDLDDSIKGAIGITGRTSFEKGQTYYDSINSNDSHSNAGGSSYVTPETIQAATQVTTAVISGLSNNNKGGSGLPDIHGDIKRKIDALKAADAERYRVAQLSQSNYNNRTQDEDKMSTSTKVLIGTGLTLFLAIGGFITYKIIKAKKAK